MTYTSLSRRFKRYNNSVSNQTGSAPIIFGSWGLSVRLKVIITAW